MIDELLKTFERYNRIEKEENLLIERLKTRAEGVGSIIYGDDASHGTATGDRLERSAIDLVEAREKIAKRRRERFKLKADTTDWLFDRLDACSAWVMKLYVIDCLSYRQISDEVGRSVGWVNKVINKSRQKLK